MNSEKSVVRLAVRVTEGILVDDRTEQVARPTPDAALGSPSASSDATESRKRIKYVIERS